MPSKTCIVVSGPTAVGKTAIAIQLAKHFATSIISADSRQCYKETTIAVAKPSVAELNEVQHYFINSHSIHDTVTAASFEKYATQCIEKIFAENELAILVGGTGLYIKAFLEGLDQIPEIDPSVRSSIIHEFDRRGMAWLKETVSKEDPDYFSTGEQDNPQRLMRALEVVRATGRSIRSFQGVNRRMRDFRIIHIGIETARAELTKRINKRVDQMVADGLVEEARNLYPFRTVNALQTVGYTELFEYFDGQISLAEAIELIKIHTRQYAKRQVTWFKKAGVDAFFSPEKLDTIIKFVELKLQEAKA